MNTLFLGRAMITYNETRSLRPPLFAALPKTEDGCQGTKRPLRRCKHGLLAETLRTTEMFQAIFLIPSLAENVVKGTCPQQYCSYHSDVLASDSKSVLGRRRGVTYTREHWLFLSRPHHGD